MRALAAAAYPRRCAGWRPGRPASTTARRTCPDLRRRHPGGSTPAADFRADGADRRLCRADLRARPADLRAAPGWPAPVNDPAALPARARALLAALAELGGQAAPGEVGARAGLGHSAQARGLAELRAAGLAAGGKRTVTLTPAGWAAAGATAALV